MSEKLCNYGITQYQYIIKLGDYGDCGSTDEYKIRRDVNNDVEDEENEAETCPERWFSKFC